MSLKYLPRRIWRRITGWKIEAACRRDLGALEVVDIESLRTDLQLALSLLESSDIAEEDCLPCKATNLAAEAIHLVRSASGAKVRPPMYGTGFYTLRQHLFGYYAPSRPDTAGRRPMLRLYRNQ